MSQAMMTTGADTETRSPTVVGLLEQRAQEWPDRVCLWFGDEPVTYRELLDRALSAAAGMHRRGVRRGDRVAIFMENSREFAECWLGTMRLGALAVPINLAYRGEFLRHQLVDSGAVLVITDAGSAAAVFDIVEACSEVQGVFVRDGGSPSEQGVSQGVPTADLSELFGEVDEAAAAPVESGDAATIIYTSGTTGRSKGVVMSHRYLATIGQVLSGALGLVKDDVLYLPLPMFHLSGLSAVLTSLATGSSSVIDQRFSVSGFWDRVRTRNASAALLVGPMLQMLWELPPEAADAEVPLRVLGAAPIPPGMEVEIPRRYRCGALTMYGMTEAFPLAIAQAGEPFPPGSCGRRNPVFDLRLVDEDGLDVAVGEIGELVCRSTSANLMFDGYFGSEGSAPDSQDGWFHTGDLLREDADGFLYFVDRKKDAIRRRGENISSFEVEHAIRMHPLVADVAVHGVPSPHGEEDVKAVLVLAPGDAPSYEDLHAFFAAELPRFAVPRYIEFVSSLPRNPVGRLLKYQLRARGLTPETWDRLSDEKS